MDIRITAVCVSLYSLLAPLTLWPAVADMTRSVLRLGVTDLLRALVWTSSRLWASFLLDLFKQQYVLLGWIVWPSTRRLLHCAVKVKPLSVYSLGMRVMLMNSTLTESWLKYPVVGLFVQSKILKI